MLATGLGQARWAAAEVEHVPLTWHAPASCPSAEAVLTDIQRNLADSDPNAPFVAVVNVLGSKGGQWQATLRIEARGGFVDRRFVAESCEAIASAAALIIALSAESGAGASAEPPPPPAAPAPKMTLSVAAPRTRERSPFSIGVAQIIDVMTMPGAPALGVEVTGMGSWAASGWRARLIAGAAFFPYHAVSDHSLQGVFRMGVVSGRGCLSGDIRSLEVGFCVGGELGAIHSSGTGEDYSGSVETATKPVLSPVASLVAAWTLTPRLAFFARADLAVNAVHPTFYTFSAYNAELFTVPVVSARGTVGLELGL